MPKPVMVSDQAWKLGNIFYLDPQTLDRFFYKTTGWSPLGRLFEIYRDDFPADHNQYLPDKNKIMTSQEAFKRFSQRLAEILRTKKLEEIETALSSTVGQYIGRPTTHPLKVQFSLPSHRELFEKWVTLQIAENTNIPPLPVDRLGSGYRALLRLAVLQTLLNIQKSNDPCILLIEEPEVFLHVHLRRYFFKVLSNLAAAGNQVVYTTHSPEFVDLARPHEIIRLHRSESAVTQPKQVAPTTKLDFENVKQKVRRMGNQEVVFASHAILTEGQDDQGVLQELLTRADIDTDVLSISVVNCDGVAQIKDYVRLCAELGIDFYAVHDRDNDTELLTKKRNKAIQEAVSASNPPMPSLHVYDPTLEAAMQTQKQKSNLDSLLALLGDKDYKEISSQFPKLVLPIDEFISTRNLKPAPPSITAEAAAPEPAETTAAAAERPAKKINKSK